MSALEHVLCGVSDGNRHAALGRMFRAGHYDGMSAEQTAEVIVARLAGQSETRFRKDVQRFARWFAERSGESSRPRIRRAKPSNPDALFDCLAERGRLVADGRDPFAMLGVWSHLPVVGLPPIEQAVQHMRRLACNPWYKVFAGEKFHCGPYSVRTPDEWEAQWRFTGEIPTLVQFNQVDGHPAKTTEGKPSYRSQACIRTFRHALLEFDDTPLEDQAYFALGLAAAEDVRLRPVSVVFSGNKSLHTVVEVQARNAGEYAAIWDGLMSALSAHGSRNPCDAACKDCGRLTRLAGATRDNGKVQTLLYLSYPSAEEAPPIPLPGETEMQAKLRAAF